MNFLNVIKHELLEIRVIKSFQFIIPSYEELHTGCPHQSQNEIPWFFPDFSLISLIFSLIKIFIFPDYSLISSIYYLIKSISFPSFKDNDL